MRQHRTNHVVNWFSCLSQVFFVICYPLLFKIELLPLHLSCLCFLRLACLGFTIGIASISEGLASGTIAGTWVSFVLINWDGLDQLDVFFVDGVLGTRLWACGVVGCTDLGWSVSWESPT